MRWGGGREGRQTETFCEHGDGRMGVGREIGVEKGSR